MIILGMAFLHLGNPPYLHSDLKSFNLLVPCLSLFFSLPNTILGK